MPTTMNVKGIDIDQLTECLFAGYVADAELCGENLEDEIKALLTPLLHTHTWNKLKVRTSSSVDVKGNAGVKIKVNARVDGDPDQRQIFLWVNNGTKDRKPSGKVVPILDRSNTWTKPNQLKLFHGVTRGVVFRRDTGKGIPARNFYKTAVKQLAQKIGRAFSKVIYRNNEMG